MNKRFVFVDLSIDSGYYGVNHGISYLVPIIKKHSYEVSILHLTKRLSSRKFRGKIEKLNPQIVGFSFTSPQLKYFIKYSNAIAGLPNLIQIAGGVGPTLSPELVFEKSNIQGIVIGEGEKPLNQLLDNLNDGRDIYHIEGFYWKTNGTIIRNPVPAFTVDLSALDFPDYSDFERSVVVSPENNSLSVMLSRGCPYNCTYCCNKALRERYPSAIGYFRLPSVGYSVEFLEKLTSRYSDINAIEFFDDLLVANKGWFIEFAEQYEKKINIPCRMNVRPESINAEIIEALKRMRCYSVFIGLESGNEALRKSILNRHYSNELFIEKSKMIKDAGIDLYTFNIVGFPGEKIAQMNETYELNKQVDADNGKCSFFYPFPETKLYEICKKEKLLLSDKEMQKITNYNTKPAIKLDHRKECITIQRMITNYFAEKSLQRKCGNLHASKPTIFTLILWIKTRILRNRSVSELTHNRFIQKAFVDINNRLIDKS